MGKRLLALFFLLGAMLAILLCADQSAQAVRAALALCAQSVVPALFPFFVLSGLFISLGYAESVGAAFAPLMRHLLGCPDVGAVAFFLGITGGYPIGGRTVGELCRTGRCSREEAAQLLTFCNNAGPAFILGIAGSGCFHDVRCGVWLYLIHITAALLSGMLLRGKYATSGSIRIHDDPPFTSAFVQSIRSGTMAMLQISGFVVFFQVICQLLATLRFWQHPLLLGVIELTGGMMALPCSAQGFIWASGLLGWGGLSVHCQTAAVLSGTGIPMRRYFLGKLLQAGISMLLAMPISGMLFA